MAFRLMIAGGGTGGHLFPGVAVAEEFQRRDPDTRVLFVGTGRPVEAEVLGPRGFENRVIAATGLKGKSLSAVLKSLVSLPKGLWEAMSVIREFSPDAILGVGGYVSGPVGLAGRLLGITTAIHEQNSVPGLANRWLGRLVNLVFASFESSRKYFPDGKVVMTGNPIRGEISEAAALEPKKENGSFTLLIAGGSQGAHAVNVAMMEAVGLLAEKMPNLKVIHQTGRKDESVVSRSYEWMNVNASVKAFITDMERVYREADLVVCRAGALTVAEVAVMGKPAIFIPLPTAADNHQEINARSMVDAGAAEIMLQSRMTREALAESIRRLADDPERRAEMSRAALASALPNAASDICDALESHIAAKKQKRH